MTFGQRSAVLKGHIADCRQVKRRRGREQEIDGRLRQLVIEYAARVASSLIVPGRSQPVLQSIRSVGARQIGPWKAVAGSKDSKSRARDPGVGGVLAQSVEVGPFTPDHGTGSTDIGR